MSKIHDLVVTDVCVAHKNGINLSEALLRFNAAGYVRR
jgi:hypothetical protein